MVPKYFVIGDKELEVIYFKGQSVQNAIKKPKPGADECEEDTF